MTELCVGDALLNVHDGSRASERRDRGQLWKCRRQLGDG